MSRKASNEGLPGRTRGTMNRRTRIAVPALLAGAVVLLGLLAVYPPLKPPRVVAPEMSGLTCVEPPLCVETPETIVAATALRDGAVQFVTETLGPLENTLRVLFCATQACFARFGNPAVAALSRGGLDTLILNETGWHDYLVRPELDASKDSAFCHLI